MNISSLLDSASNLISRVALKMSGERPVIVHNHLFKNAGSTVDWALQQVFGAAFVDHRDDEEMRKGAEYLGPYINEHKNIKALSSHHLTMPLPEISGIKIISIMMLRNPIERVTSVYKFERAQISDTHPGVIHSQKHNLRDYIHWRMQPEVGSTIRNFQARKMLPPRNIGQEAITENEMAMLKRQLLNIEMLGLVARFDESMVLFEEYLQKIFPRIDLSYLPQNVRQELSMTTESRLEKLKTDIGTDTYDLLLKKNREDLQLFQYAETELSARISRVKRFDEKLANFRARCKAKMQNL